MVASAKSITSAANSLAPLHGRPPPWSIDAEAACISAAALDSSGVALETVRAIIGDGDAFFDERHKLVYRSMCALADAGKPYDHVTISRKLTEDGKIHAAGGMPFIVTLIDATPAVLNVASHAEIVRDCWRLRQMLALSQTTIAEIYTQETGDVEEFLATLEARVSDLARPRISRELRPLGDWMREAQDFVFAAQDGDKGVTGIPTGFTRIDKRTAGLGRGDLFYIAGRPGQGKTAYALGIARRIAGRGEAVAFFSLEMPGYQVALRLIAAEARINLLTMRSGMLKKNDLSDVMNAIATLSKLPIFIDDTPAPSVFDVRARAKRLTRDIEAGRIACKPLSLVVIDYLQLMTMPRPSEYASREQQVAALSRELKQFAKALSVPVVPLSQLNREVERRGGDKRPQLSDLRESGQLEADADLIQFLYRDEYYNKGSPDKGIAEVITAKQRNGPTGIDKLAFDAECTRFDNFEDAPAPQYSNQLPLPSAGYDDYEEQDG